jgi:hypothetical protein
MGWGQGVQRPKQEPEVRREGKKEVGKEKGTKGINE